MVVEGEATVGAASTALRSQHLGAIPGSASGCSQAHRPAATHPVIVQRTGSHAAATPWKRRATAAAMASELLKEVPVRGAEERRAPRRRGRG
jgi:hypothetical protein